MPLHRCPYCRDSFTPSRYHPTQVVCNRTDCQRRRRSEYHRRKVQNDPSYRQQCWDSQKKWRHKHPDYMRRYRKSPARPRAQGARDESSKGLVEILKLVKNSVAFDLKACPARVFLICSDKSVKNILATAKLILIQGLTAAERGGAHCKEHPFGNSADPVV